MGCQYGGLIFTLRTLSLPVVKSGLMLQKAQISSLNHGRIMLPRYIAFPPIAVTLLTALLLCLGSFPSMAGNANASLSRADLGHDGLLSRYRQLAPLLQDNQYGVPLYIQSRFGDTTAQGDVYAVVKHRFATVADNLNTPGQWCDVLLLHINVKGCDLGNLENTADRPQQEGDLTLYVGRNYFQTPDEAHEMSYKFAAKANDGDYIQVDLTALDGPLGTSNYRLIFEAVPFNDNESFIHFKYAYQYGFMARLALDGYLATLGRNKVGFSVKGYDKNHEPLYVKGLQGIVERNSMRYFIAIRSFLDTASLEPQQWSTRIDRWNSLAKRFERQLVEVRDNAYLETKTQEFTTREIDPGGNAKQGSMESADLEKPDRPS